MEQDRGLEVNAPIRTLRTNADSNGLPCRGEAEARRKNVPGIVHGRVRPSWRNNFSQCKLHHLLAELRALRTLPARKVAGTHVEKRPHGLRASHLHLVIEILVASPLRLFPRMKKSRAPFKNPRP